ncbi:hypothetical protein LVJ94_31195 [Pendulispora rubella]|uniref:DUF1570 domain-containing protein n=1 Tax=Pendulispora rubella TaxID=2741070 RepID=A0ABZ2KRR1_9BACT
MKKTLLWMAALGFALAACGGSGAGPSAAGPEREGSAWTEVASPHFTLRTDLDAKTAQDVSSQLETIFSSLLELGFDSALGPATEMRTHIDLVYFRNGDEYRRVAPKLSVGEFRRELHDFERTPLALFYGDFVQRTREIVQHELTHFFVHAHYPQAPIWLDEGLAEYFSTLELTDGSAVLGRPPKMLRFWKGPWHSENVDGEIRTSIPMSEAIPVGTLLGMDVQAFEGMSNADPNTAAGQKASQAMATNYASAWNLVHVLMVDPNYRRRFDKYRRRLLEGDASDISWEETMDDVPLPALEKAYEASLVRFETTIQRTQYAPPRTPAPRVRALSDADVHVMWARLRNWETPEGRAAAEADMKEAAAREPLHPDLAALRAYWSTRQDDLENAAKALEPALAARPNDARLLNALGWVQVRRIAKKELPPSALDPVVAKLTPIASTAAEFDLLAHGRAVHGDMNAALTYEKRATTADPSCYACFFYGSILLDAKGRVREALQAASLAVHMLPDGAQVPNEMLTQMALYRRRLSETTGNAPSAPRPPTR